MLKILELFGGIGAPRIALENLIKKRILNLPLKSIDYVEIDKKAVHSYNLLFNHLKSPESVVNYNLRPDILIHGSPCQDFSRAGMRLGGKAEDKTRSSLMWETIRIIQDFGFWKPKIVIWENVKGVLDKDNINTFNKYIETLNRLGYKSSYKVLNSIDFGIPQTRNRVFVVSTLNSDLFDFNKLEKKEMKSIEFFLEKKVDDYYYIKMPSMLSAIEKGKIKEITTHCQTITTKQWRWNNAGYIKDKKGVRILTPRECWRLMGYTDNDYDKVQNLSRHELWKQAGNSIVVNVLEEIFIQLFKQNILTIKEQNE